MAEPSWHPGMADPWTFDSLCWRLAELVRDAGSAAGSHRALPVDVAETDDGYVVEVDLPGISTGDVHVDVIGNEIRVRGEIRPRDSPASCATTPAEWAASTTRWPCPARSMPVGRKRRWPTACSRCAPRRPNPAARAVSRWSR